jgi:uncharacterized glyoxalase superfamily protein PhnB
MTVSFDFIGLTVADMGASLAFYRLLGLDLPDDADTAPHAEVKLPSGIRLGWDTIDTIQSFDPEWTAPHGSSRISLAFLCESPAEVDKMHATITAAGYRSHKDPWDAFWGQRYATVLDPDGNGVDLFAPLA